MPRFIRYQEGQLPTDVLVLRVIRRRERAVGFVQEIDFGDGGIPYYPNEKVAMPEAIRLAANCNDSGGPVLVKITEQVWSKT
ncbi:MAG: hypothetical protein ABGX47_10865 [Martelella sp.]|uniref:hypothetical protein n=1 Tax=Martelella sp. TaxID=1969699 RepID=UPI003241EB20